MRSAPRIRLLYADDNSSYRTSLLRSFVAEPTIELVAVAVDGESALEAIVAHEPDVALVDLRTPGLSGLDIAERLAEREPACQTRVLLLTSLPMDSTRRVLETVGLGGVIDRAASREEIIAALSQAAAAA